jgi:hypothetical protein
MDAGPAADDIQAREDEAVVEQRFTHEEMT